MSTQSDNDHLSPEGYARRLNAGDEILYLPEAATYVHKSICTLRYYRHLGIGPRSPSRPTRTDMQEAAHGTSVVSKNLTLVLEGDNHWYQHATAPV